MNTQKFYQGLTETTKSGQTPYVITSGQGAYLTIEGKQKLNFCSSHYLGLAVADRVKKAVKEAVDTYGMGTGYRSLAGTHTLHVQLEEALARFKKAEAVIVLQGGYMANCAAIQTILTKEDMVISDELNHASIIDAIRLSQVQNKFVYQHRDIADLESKLKEAARLQKIPKENGQERVVLIVTDGVFSMDGDLAPLPEIVQLAKKYRVLTMVDDAHGEGVLGKGGRGIVDHFNLHGSIDIEVGTLSKAFSVMGGYIAAKKALIDYYKQKARQFLFSNALTIADSAAALVGVKILEESDTLVKTLWDNANYLKEQFKRVGFDTGQSQTPITPLMIGNEDLAREFSRRLFELGVFATPIVYPMVAKGLARIRVIPSSIHTKLDLDFGIQVFAQVGKELKILE